MTRLRMISCTCFLCIQCLCMLLPVCSLHQSQSFTSHPVATGLVHEGAVASLHLSQSRHRQTAEVVTAVEARTRLITFLDQLAEGLQASHGRSPALTDCLVDNGSW